MVGATVCSTLEVSGPAGVATLVGGGCDAAGGCVTGGDIADTASDTEDPGSLGVASVGGSAGVCGVAGAAGVVGRLETSDSSVAVVVGSVAGGAGGVEVVAASAAGATCPAVVGADIACEGRGGGDGRDSSAQAFIGSTRATAPIAAMTSGRTRAGAHRQCDSRSVSGR